MPLHPQAEAILRAMVEARIPPIETMTPQEVRVLRRQNLQRWNLLPDSDVQEDNREIPGPAGPIPVRVYTPTGRPPFPGLIYYHGGGWVLGDLDAYDHVCRLLARAAGCVVVSVGYRLAPEYPFPAGLEDAHASLQWVLSHAAEMAIDGERIAAAGDSAGANLLTVACHLARQRGGRLPVCEILIYPVTQPPGMSTSEREFGDGYFLTTRGMRWFLNHYAAGAAGARENPLIFPILIDDLRGMPPTLIMTAEYDPLRDEGEAYADRLREAGVPVVCRRYPGMIHGFLSLLPPMDAREQLIQEVADYLRGALAGV